MKSLFAIPLLFAAALQAQPVIVTFAWEESPSAKTNAVTYELYAQTNNWVEVVTSDLLGGLYTNSANWTPTTITNATTTTSASARLAPGTWYVAAATVGPTGKRSALSNVVKAFVAAELGTPAPPIDLGEVSRVTVTVQTMKAKKP